MDVQIIVTTFGDPYWLQRGAAVAEKHSSARHFHATNPASLGEARNRAVQKVDPKEWICFLDADDELEPGYIEAMKAVQKPEGSNWSHLRVPALRLGAGAQAKTLDGRDIMMLNPCPIGTLIHREMFDLVGGFWDEPAWEDWSLFRRCVLLGAELVFVPHAVYRANSTREGRNSKIRRPKELHANIVESHIEWMGTK